MTIIATEICKLREEAKRTVAKIIAHNAVYLEGEIEEALTQVEKQRERLTALKNLNLDDKEAVRELVGNFVAIDDRQYNIRELLKQY